jgi:predicted transcriptional regulator of viral defense system
MDYAVKMDVGVVFRRLGYLMEIYEIGLPIHQQFLQTQLTTTYNLLDPDLPAEGSYIAKWRLRLNVTTDELIKIRET